MKKVSVSVYGHCSLPLHVGWCVFIVLLWFRGVLSAGFEPLPKEQWTATASGYENEESSPSYAIDGDMKTRWSSPWADPHWLQIDLGKPTALCGLTLYWEHAYSTAYEIQVSQDGIEWETVYHTQQGDGRTDELNFRPVTASYIRIQGNKRSSSWGHSLWEVDVKGPSECIHIMAPSADGCDAGDLCDGKLDAVWTAGESCPAPITIDLRKAKTFAGLRIDWGKIYASDIDVELSVDGKAWDVATELHDGTGDFDYLMWEPVETRFIRLIMNASAEDQPVQIREMSFRSAEEAMDKYAVYEIAARKARPGLYPDWLRGRQTYWTLVGLPSDTKESLLDEYGNVEPMKGSSCLMPYLFVDGRLLSAHDADKVIQTLEKQYLPLPGVSWIFPALTMEVQAQADGAISDSVTYVEYTVRNISDAVQTGMVYLVMRPIQINPKWQFGGFYPIKSMMFNEAPEGVIAHINGNDDYVSLTPPQAYGVQPFSQGDVVRSLEQGIIPGHMNAEAEDGFLSGAMAYSFHLQPGAQTNIIVAAPLHEDLKQVQAFRQGDRSPHIAFKQARNRLTDFWQEQLCKVVIDVPDQEVVDSLYAQLGYILINRDGPTIQPASRNYKRGWIRDGSVTSTTLLRMGMTAQAREFLEWYSQFVEEDGLVHHIVNSDGTVSDLFTGEDEWDSQGEYVYAIMEYYRFTKDKTFLAQHFDEIVHALQFLERLRAQTIASAYMKDVPGRDRFVGILPKSISHEGYMPAMHSYWDDFWALRGWRDGAAAAEILGHDDKAEWAREQYAQLKGSLKTAIVAAIDFKALDYVPGCAEKGDFDPTSIATAFFPCDEQDTMPQKELLRTFDLFYDQMKQRDDPAWTGQFVPYEIRSVLAYVALGQNDRAQDLLQFLLGCQRPLNWNHWVELYVSDERLGTYIGDMPHTWVGSGYVNTIRSMLVNEDKGKLVLLQGVPEAWLVGKGIHIENMPTHYGVLDLDARFEEETLFISIAGDIQAPEGIEIHWPFAAPESMIVDGKEMGNTQPEMCHVPSGTRLIEAHW